MIEIGKDYLKCTKDADSYAEILHAVLSCRQQLERIESRILKIMDREGAEPQRVKFWAKERGYSLSENALKSVNW